MIEASIKVFNKFKKRWERLNINNSEHKYKLIDAGREETYDSKSIVYCLFSPKVTHGYHKMNVKYINFYWKDIKLI